MDEIISYKMCAVKVRNAKLRNYLKSCPKSFLTSCGYPFITNCPKGLKSGPKRCLTSCDCPFIKNCPIKFLRAVLKELC